MYFKFFCKKIYKETRHTEGITKNYKEGIRYHNQGKQKWVNNTLWFIIKEDSL